MDGRAVLLGLGLDGRDGHVRITRAPDFSLFGGSQETHEHMQEVASQVMHRLKGRSISSPQELLDLIHDIER